MADLLRYDNVEPGQSLGSIEYTISPEQAERYAASLRDETGWAGANSPFGRPVAPPGMLANDYVRLLASSYEFKGGVHAKQETTYLKPPPVGERLTVTGQIIEKYERRDKLWIVVETTTTDASGEIVARSRNTLLMPSPGQEP